MVYAQEAPGFVSVGSEIAATVMERAFYALEAPVPRVSGYDTPFPPAKLEANTSRIRPDPGGRGPVSGLLMTKGRVPNSVDSGGPGRFGPIPRNID